MNFMIPQDPLQQCNKIITPTVTVLVGFVCLVFVKLS